MPLFAFRFLLLSSPALASLKGVYDKTLAEQTKLGLDLAQTRYKLKLGSDAEVSQPQLAEIEAEIANANARYDYLPAQAVIRFETGSIQGLSIFRPL